MKFDSRVLTDKKLLIELLCFLLFMFSSYHEILIKSMVTGTT